MLKFHLWTALSSLKYLITFTHKWNKTNKTSHSINKNCHLIKENGLQWLRVCVLLFCLLWHVLLLLCNTLLEPTLGKVSKQSGMSQATTWHVFPSLFISSDSMWHTASCYFDLALWMARCMIGLWLRHFNLHKKLTNI